MIKKEFILQNPLRFIGDETEDILPEGGFGAVLARAGVGKTALLVQLALHTLIKSKYVLHISLDDPVNKISLWYKEVFRNLTQSFEAKKKNKLWEDLLPYRFIMTFKVEGFSVPKLEERLTDLKEQNIFSPQVVLIDGFQFNDGVRTSLAEFKKLAQNHSVHVWFSVKTHRHETHDPEGMPPSLLDVSDLFDIVIQLRHEGKKIHVMTLKGGPPDSDRPALFLDPATMLVKDTI
ncbi:MAG: AAA family ATPase [Desulfobacterales bacterium]